MDEAAAAAVGVEGGLPAKIRLHLPEAEGDPFRQPALVHTLVGKGLHSIVVRTAQSAEPNVQRPQLLAPEAARGGAGRPSHR